MGLRFNNVVRWYMDTERLDRQVAHFHRLLGALLQELAAWEETRWLEPDPETHGHVIREDGEPNTYGRALYLLKRLEPYRERLAELERLQAEVMRTFGLKSVPRSLLTPLVLERVVHARLHYLEAFSSACKPRSFVLGRIDKALETTRRNYRAFARQGGVDDPRTLTIGDEITYHERAREGVRGSPEPDYRVRISQQRVRLYVYRDGEKALQCDTRLHGVILAGPNVTVTDERERREGRSDKVGLVPLWHYGVTYVYPEGAWQEAKEKP